MENFLIYFQNYNATGIAIQILGMWLWDPSNRYYTGVTEICDFHMGERRHKCETKDGKAMSPECKMYFVLKQSNTHIS